MKLCIVTTMFPKYEGDYYGSFVFDEVKALVENGIEVHVITQHNHGIPYEEIVEGIHIHRFKWLEPKEFKALIHFKGLKDNLRLVTYVVSLFFNLIRIIKEYKIDIIHAHSVIPTGFVGVIVAKIMGCPSVITSHGMDINNFEEKSIYGHLISFSLNNCNRTIAVSEDLAKTMKSLGINEDKILILRNAVDITRFRPIRNNKLRYKYDIKESEILFLFVGYLDVFKGIFEIINVFYNLNNKNKNLKLMMVGTGPKTDELKKRVFELNLEKNVIFTGKISHGDVHRYYQMADIFLLPSYTEGLPLSLLEAMACGLPVVASNVGGIPSVVEDGLNGFIVTPKNKKELSEKLETLTNNEELRAKFANKSIDIIYKNSLSIKGKINKLIELYEFL